MRVAPVAVLIACLLVAGCGTTRVPIQAVRPAETVDLTKSGVKRIAIGDIQGADGAQDLGESLREALLKVGKFELLERSQLASLVKEHQLNQSGLVDESTTAQAGKFSGATALVTGRAAAYGCSRPTRTTHSVQLTNGSFSQEITVEVKAVADVSFQILDVQTGRIVATKKCFATRTYHQTALGREPASPDTTIMIAQCREEVVDQFMHSIVPYSVAAEVAFEEDDKVPQLLAGINSAKIGDWDEAIKSFTKGTAAAPASDKAHYDLGVGYQMTGRFDDAERELKVAYRLNPCDEYGAAVKSCQVERERAKRL